MHAYGGAVGGGRGQRAGLATTPVPAPEHGMPAPAAQPHIPVSALQCAAAARALSCSPRRRLGRPRRLLGWLSAPGCLRQPEQRLSSSLRSLGLLLPHRSLVCSIFCCHAHGGGAGKPRPGWAAELDGLLLPSSASCARSAASSSPSAVPSESMSASLAREGGPGGASSGCATASSAAEGSGASATAAAAAYAAWAASSAAWACPRSGCARLPHQGLCCRPCLLPPPHPSAGSGHEGLGPLGRHAAAGAAGGIPPAVSGAACITHMGSGSVGEVARRSRGRAPARERWRRRDRHTGGPWIPSCLPRRGR